MKSGPKTGPKTGKESVIEMLRVMDSSDREKLLTNLAQKDPILAEELSNQVESFQDLLKLEPLILQNFLREVPLPLLALAMRQVDDELKAFILSQLSQRAQKNLGDEILNLGPQKVSAVKKAQQDIRALLSVWQRKTPKS